MNALSIGFGIAGIGLVIYGAFVLKKVPEQIKSGKTRLTGKLIAMGTPDISKSEHKATFWLTTGWNAIRSVLAILFGLLLIAIAVMDLLKP